jgi:hypothetical protein
VRAAAAPTVLMVFCWERNMGALLAISLIFLFEYSILVQ